MAIEDKNMKTYEQGLEDAWAAARAIGKLPKDGGLDLNELAQIFGTPHTVSIFNGFTADEAIAKIKAYEDEQHKVKVGDEVEYTDAIERVKGIVLQVFNEEGSYKVLNRFCSTRYIYDVDRYQIKKTGRHFPQVEKLLEAMNNEGDE